MHWSDSIFSSKYSRKSKSIHDKRFTIKASKPYPHSLFFLLTEANDWIEDVQSSGNLIFIEFNSRFPTKGSPLDLSHIEKEQELEFPSQKRKFLFSSKTLKATIVCAKQIPVDEVTC
jgi:hypothetical protein